MGRIGRLFCNRKPTHKIPLPYQCAADYKSDLAIPIRVLRLGQIDSSAGSRFDSLRNDRSSKLLGAVHVQFVHQAPRARFHKSGRALLLLHCTYVAAEIGRVRNQTRRQRARSSAISMYRRASRCTTRRRHQSAAEHCCRLQVLQRHTTSQALSVTQRPLSIAGVQAPQLPQMASCEVPVFAPKPQFVKERRVHSDSSNLKQDAWRSDESEVAIVRTYSTQQLNRGLRCAQIWVAHPIEDRSAPHRPKIKLNPRPAHIY